MLKKFLKELNSFRGVLIIDAKVSLKKFGEEYAFKSGYGGSTTKAKSLKTLSSLFYDVLLAEIELKLVKGEISDDEFEEFLGEKLTNNINYESSIKVKKTSNENLDYCNNSYIDEKMNKSSNTYQANVFEGNCPKCGYSVNKFTNNPVAIKCHMCNHTFWF